MRIPMFYYNAESPKNLEKVQKKKKKKKLQNRPTDLQGMRNKLPSYKLMY